MSAMTSRKPTGFTIVELLIVIVVIGILAAITVVAYNGIQDRARRVSLTSDLVSASKQLKLDQVVASNYPATVSSANGAQGLKASPGTTYRYSVNNSVDPQSFCLSAQNGSIFYMTTESTTPSEGSCVNVALGASATSSLLTDGNTNSSPYYNAGLGLQQVTVTLNSAVDISSIKVWHYWLDGRTYHATKSDVSLDGSTWTTVFDSATSGEYAETSAGHSVSFPTSSVKYIRDWINGSTSNTGNH